MVEYTKFETISLKNHPELDEKWLQARIVEETSILGLGGILLSRTSRGGSQRPDA